MPWEFSTRQTIWGSGNPLGWKQCMAEGVFREGITLPVLFFVPNCSFTDDVADKYRVCQSLCLNQYSCSYKTFMFTIIKEQHFKKQLLEECNKLIHSQGCTLLTHMNFVRRCQNINPVREQKLSYGKQLLMDSKISRWDTCTRGSVAYQRPQILVICILHFWKTSICVSWKM